MVPPSTDLAIIAALAVIIPLAASRRTALRHLAAERTAHHSECQGHTHTRSLLRQARAISRARLWHYDVLAQQCSTLAADYAEQDEYATRKSEDAQIAQQYIVQQLQERCQENDELRAQIRHLTGIEAQPDTPGYITVVDPRTMELPYAAFSEN